jgi:hypothetical protein
MAFFDHDDTRTRKPRSIAAFRPVMHRRLPHFVDQDDDAGVSVAGLIDPLDDREGRCAAQAARR